MSPEELREKVAAAILDAIVSGNSPTDAALAVVREAMREPSEEMLCAVGDADNEAYAGGNLHGADFEWLWAVALAASSLREPGA